MKRKHRFVRCMSVLLILLPTAAGCTVPSASGTPSGSVTLPAQDTTYSLPDDRIAMYEALIQALEEQLLQEKAERWISDSTYEETVAALRARQEEPAGDTVSVTAAPAPYETEHLPSNAPPEPVCIVETETQPPEPAAVSPARLRCDIRDGEAVIHAVSGGGPDLVLPATVDGFPVTAIADDAMRGADITSVTLPDTVREIGWFAFADCPNLQTVTLPGTLCSIGYGAFSGCPRLTVVCADDTYAAAWAQSYGLPTRVPKA